MNNSRHAKPILLLLLALPACFAIKLQKIEKDGPGPNRLCFNYYSPGSTQSQFEICTQNASSSLSDFFASSADVTAFDLSSIVNTSTQIGQLNLSPVSNPRLALTKDNIALEFGVFQSDKVVDVNLEGSDCSLVHLIPVTVVSDQQSEPKAVGFCVQPEKTGEFLIVHLEVSDKKVSHHKILGTDEQSKSKFSEIQDAIFKSKDSSTDDDFPTFYVNMKTKNPDQIKHSLLKIENSSIEAVPWKESESHNNELTVGTVTNNEIDRSLEIPPLADGYYLLILHATEPCGLMLVPPKAVDFSKAKLGIRIRSDDNSLEGLI